MSGGRAHSKNVSWSKPQEPSFLKAFKDKVGYKEPSSIDAKHETKPPPSVEDREDREDELPTVVVLRAGDVSQEEFLEHRKYSKEKKGNESNDGDCAGGKIMFKKPTKRKSSDVTAVGVSTSKKLKPNEEHSSYQRTQRTTKSKGIKNKSLLSFDDDEQ